MIAIVRGYSVIYKDFFILFVFLGPGSGQITREKPGTGCRLADSRELHSKSRPGNSSPVCFGIAIVLPTTRTGFTVLITRINAINFQCFH